MSVTVREIPLKDGGITFTIAIYHKSQRLQVKTEIQAERPKGREYQTARRQAEARAAELEAQLKIDPAAVFQGKQQRSTDFIQYFKEESTLGEIKGGGIRKENRLYPATLKHLKDFNGKSPLPMTNITEAWAVRFRAYIDNLDIKPTTKATYIAALKAILNKAVDEHLIPDFTRKIKQFKKNDTSLKYLSLEQIKTLEATPCGNSAVKAGFLFSCCVGLRISDIFALKDADVHKEGDKVEIRFKMQKTQKWQTLSMGTQALKYLEEAKKLHVFRQNGDYRVFPLPGPSGSQKSLRVWGKAAGISFQLGWHAGRHTFAVEAIRAGVDIYTLSKLMGHSSVSITQLYAKVIDETRAAAMNMMPVW